MQLKFKLGWPHLFLCLIPILTMSASLILQEEQNQLINNNNNNNPMLKALEKLFVKVFSLICRKVHNGLLFLWPCPYLRKLSFFSCFPWQLGRDNDGLIAKDASSCRNTVVQVPGLYVALFLLLNTKKRRGGVASSLRAVYKHTVEEEQTNSSC